MFDASSETGIDGTVVRPETVITGQLVQLPQRTLDASALLRAPCAARRGQTGSFVVRGRDGLPVEPDGYLPAPIGDEPLSADTASNDSDDGAIRWENGVAAPVALIAGCPL